MSLSGLSDELSQVRTKKKEFLSQIERIVPWGEWIELIRPHYYKGERGNKPYDLERMLRIYLVQNLYDLSDMATVAEVIDSRTAEHSRNSAEWNRAIRCRTAIRWAGSGICCSAAGCRRSCLRRWYACCRKKACC